MLTSASVAAAADVVKPLLYGAGYAEVRSCQHVHPHYEVLAHGISLLSF